MSSEPMRNSSSTGPLAAGDYSYQGVYSGDGNFKTSTGSCERSEESRAGETGEPLLETHAAATSENHCTLATERPRAQVKALVALAGNVRTGKGWAADRP